MPVVERTRQRRDRNLVTGSATERQRRLYTNAELRRAPKEAREIVAPRVGRDG
jgi:hypothetical protein